MCCRQTGALNTRELSKGHGGAWTRLRTRPTSRGLGGWQAREVLGSQSMESFETQEGCLALDTEIVRELG